MATKALTAKEDVETTGDEFIDFLETAVQYAEFELEEKQDEAQSANIFYKINSYGGDLDVHGLVRRFKDGDIFWPEFQRNYVWSKTQASRFIESILIGLPTPSLFLYKETLENKFFIVDGFQRITTLHAFMNNEFPPGTGKKFQLSGISEKSKFYKKTYEELEPKDRRTFDNTIIHIQFIEQTSPKNDHSAAFNIFERLNSGGTPLHPQEMRNALYEGTFQKRLVELNENEQWRSIFGGTRHNRGKDIEMILRFLALCNFEKKYRTPMKFFLNDFMGRFRKADNKKLNLFTHQFEETLNRVYKALGNEAFRLGPYKNFSASFFDAFMVAVAGNKNATKKMIATAYEKLQSDEQFLSFTQSGTTNTHSVSQRIKIVREALNASS